MIRSIRILGAALGAFVGLGLAAAGTGLFVDLPYAGFVLAAWTIAWVVVGFAVLPYLTVVPARWLIEQRPGAVDRRVRGRGPRPVRRPPAGPAAGPPAGADRGPAGHLAAARDLAVPRPRDDGPDGRQAVRPDRGGRGAGLIRRPGAKDEQAEGDPRSSSTRAC